MSKAPPLERLGTPEDIANVIAFLVSNNAGLINGQTIHANAGVV
jgi:3-oxoacyl-[acyl-carrier protein] reductase